MAAIVIKIKLERDQLRAVQDSFFPYMILLCETRLRDCMGDADDIINTKAIQSLFFEVKEIIDKKLETKAKVFPLEFTYAQSVAVNYLLIQLPINKTEVWLVNLRQLIWDTIQNQLLEL